jgi:2-C-methyl-D-erythritol 4-phosphate cytidylyltransferase
MIVWGVVVAGGGGSRFGGLKQFALLDGRRVIDWSIEALAPACIGLLVVVPPDHLDEVANRPDLAAASELVVVAGGATRSESVRAALAALDPSATHVLVHDAARPLVSAALVQRVCAALAAGARSVIPVVPVTDSLRTIDGEPVDRSQLVAVQTPQGFEVDVLRAAHRQSGTATDDASLLHALGVAVAHVEGESTNLKITDPHDLRVAEVLLHER